MTSEYNTPEVPPGSWTLATGTRSGERHVHPIMSQSRARVSTPEVKS